MRRSIGFTLIEVMIVVAIIGILAAIAYPSYQQYIIRSNRAAAQTTMMDIANRQQQFLMANRSYVNKAAIEGSGYSVPNEIAGLFTWTVATGNNPPSFTITFTPASSRAGTTPLTLNHQGTRTPADEW